MNQSADVNDTVERGLLARFGLAFLGLLVPGLGLVMADKVKLGLIFASISFGSFILLLIYYVIGPEMTFGALVVIILVAGATFLVCQIGSSIFTFFASKYVAADKRVWSRWFMAPIYLLTAFGLNQILLDQMRSQYRAFYIPAISMSPTLQVNDRFFLKIVDYQSVGRGDIVVFRANGVEYVKRIVGLPGDTVGLANGRLVLNGEIVPTEAVVESVAAGLCDFTPNATRSNDAIVLSEQLPGNRSSYQIVDCERSTIDEFADVKVPSEHYFMMGDNRDRSADSRMAPPIGLGMVSQTEIVGKPLFIHWSDRREKIGRRLNGDMPQ